MAAKAGKIEKQLKAPDQFVSFWSQVGAKISANRKPLLLGLAALVGVVVITAATRTIFAGRAERASAAFSKIHRVATAPLDGAATPAPGDTTPRYKTDRERSEAALKEVDAFLAAHGSSSLRDEALLQRGRLLIAVGRGAEAVTLYTTLGPEVDERLRFLAEEGLAYAHEATGDKDKALAVVGALADKSKGAGNFFRDRALFHKARLLEEKGQAKEAEKVYREILSETPTSALKEDINNRLAILEGAGPAAPAPGPGK